MSTIFMQAVLDVFQNQGDTKFSNESKEERHSSLKNGHKMPFMGQSTQCEIRNLSKFINA